MPLRLISLNVGQPRDVAWRGKTVRTGIFKEPVAGPRALDALNVEGDRQADLKVHGGAHKAVYLYPAEHYPYWQGELPGVALPWGAFGENFTAEGLSEQQVQIGDRFAVGTAELMVTEPRVPCYKLGLRFGHPDMVRRFLASRRSGFYLAVTRPGVVEAGDAITPLSRAGHGITVAAVMELYAAEPAAADLLLRAADLEALSPAWRDFLRQELAQREAP